MEVEVKQIFANVTFGATGAPTLVAANSKGVKSISRTSAGKYVLTMGTPASSQAATTDVYKKLLGFRLVFLNATAPAAPNVYLAANAISTAGTVTFQCTISDGTATDPASGEAAFIQLIFGDSNT